MSGSRSPAPRSRMASVSHAFRSFRSPHLRCGLRVPWPRRDDDVAASEPSRDRDRHVRARDLLPDVARGGSRSEAVRSFTRSGSRRRSGAVAGRGRRGGPPPAHRWLRRPNPPRPRHGGPHAGAGTGSLAIRREGTAGSATPPAHVHQIVRGPWSLLAPRDLMLHGFLDIQHPVRARRRR